MKDNLTSKQILLIIGFMFIIGFILFILLIMTIYNPPNIDIIYFNCIDNNIKTEFSFNCSNLSIIKNNWWRIRI